MQADPVGYYITVFLVIVGINQLSDFYKYHSVQLAIFYIIFNPDPDVMYTHNCKKRSQ